MPRTVTVENSIGARVGDTVLLDVAPRGVLGIAALLYLVPAVAGLIGAVVGAEVAPALLGVSVEIGALVFLALSLLVTLLILRALHPRLAALRSFQVVMRRDNAPGDSPVVEETERG